MVPAGGGSILNRRYWVNLSPAVTQADRAAEAASRISEHERAVIIAENPVLAEYLAWKRLHPGRELEDCLKEKFRR